MNGSGTAVILIWLMACEVFSTFLVECPVGGKNCTNCTSDADKNFWFQCFSNKHNTVNDSYFEVYYFQNRESDMPPYWGIKIFCANNPNWSDFNVSTKTKLKNASIIIFENCDIPADPSLVSIVNQFIDNNTTDVVDGRWKGLAFRSERNLTLKLTHRAMKDFSEYDIIDISRNELQNVSDDLLRGFNNLKKLYLHLNDIKTLSAKFLNFPSLMILSMSYCKIHIIENTMFKNLPKLEELCLEGNQIIKIESNSFTNNCNLIILDLSNNSLTMLPLHIFDSLHNLTELSLSENCFAEESLSVDLFLNNARLEIIRLAKNSGNLTSLPNDIFKSQLNLEQLYLDGNGFTELPSGLLRNLGKLIILFLNNNNLETLPESFFKSCKKLFVLNLSYNNIMQMSSNVFSGLGGIQYLYMEQNRLQHIDINVVRSMSHLKHANFSCNELNFNNYSGVQTSPSPFYYNRDSIEVLDLSNNYISEIHDDWLAAPQLQELYLSNNQLTRLSHTSIHFTSKYTVLLDLSFNKIRSIDLSKLDSINSNRSYPLVEVTLEGNSVDCDCSVYHLLRHYKKMTSLTSQKLFTIILKNLTCAEPPELRNTFVKELDLKLPQCSEVATCPMNCKCFHRAWDQAHLINCSHRGWTDMPSALNPGSTRPTELDMSGNFLTSVPPLSQLGYRNLTVLSLSQNQISSLLLRDLSVNLARLNLDGNNLTQLNEEDIVFLGNSTKLKTLTLHDNPWICDCNTLDFLDFIRAKHSEFTDLQRVTCNSMNASIFKMTRVDVCPSSVALIVGSIITFILLLLTAISAAVYYRYETEIKVWLFAHQLLPWLVNETELDRGKIFDAFISYSHQDEDFVANTLVPKLEEGPHAFKLCLHHRDWLVGEDIAEQIERSVTDSRRTIVVLSPNFFQSEWGKVEFRTAHCSALSEGRVRVIIIIYGDIGPIDELEPELASYMRTNTYIAWGDRWFWEKVRYALPHPLKNVRK